MNKIFDVYIRDVRYPVYNIPDKAHDGLNDIPKNWWLYFHIDGENEEFNEQYLIPFDSSIKRLCWNVNVKMHNSVKEKYDYLQFRNSVSVALECNGKEVFNFACGDLNYGINKAQVLMVQITEHPYNFFNPVEEKGRKIHYYGLPATIQPSSHPGEITVYPDYDVMPKERWWKEYKRRQSVIDAEDEEMIDGDIEEYRMSDSINHGSALSDGYIGWFRK